MVFNANNALREYNMNKHSVYFACQITFAASISSVNINATPGSTTPAIPLSNTTTVPTLLFDLDRINHVPIFVPFY